MSKAKKYFIIQYEFIDRASAIVSGDSLKQVRQAVDSGDIDVDDEDDPNVVRKIEPDEALYGGIPWDIKKIKEIKI